MILYQNYKTYSILGTTINMIYDIEADYPISVAEVDNKIHYLGNDGDGVAPAIFVWQEINNRQLSVGELHQILIDNNLVNK